MAKYRKRPIIVEAEQFLPPAHYPKGVYDVGVASYYIDTLEGTYNVLPKDWIITGVKGEKYPCKPDIFEMTYELVEDHMS